MKSEQARFLTEEFLTWSINGALGRSRTYLKSVSEKDKESLRQDLRRELKKIAARYTTPVMEQTHVSNIQELASYLSSKYCQFLMGGRFRIGIAQKALNLYLKYLWCVGFIPAPPHCPFDERMIDQLPGCSDLNWTSLNTIAEYQRLVGAARARAGSMSLSNWELEAWNNER